VGVRQEVLAMPGRRIWIGDLTAMADAGNAKRLIGGICWQTQKFCPQEKAVKNYSRQNKRQSLNGVKYKCVKG